MKWNRFKFQENGFVESGSYLHYTLGKPVQAVNFIAVVREDTNHSNHVIHPYNYYYSSGRFYEMNEMDVDFLKDVRESF